MKVGVTGASGFVGRALVERLRAGGHEVTPLFVRQLRTVPPLDAVVHLAGEPVAQRWTKDAKQRILESRVDGTEKLIHALARSDKRPSVFVCASAVGYYGSRGDEVLAEDSPPGYDFLARVCLDWERAADAAQPAGMRVVKLRIGMVLGREGGALAKMLPVFRLGLGGRLGSGRQWTSWIHREDLLSLIEFAIARDDFAGAVNATAPEPVTNARFTEELGRALHRPALFAVPEFALRLVYGEMGSVLLDSQRAVPRAAQSAGFDFGYPELEAALAGLLQPRLR